MFTKARKPTNLADVDRAGAREASLARVPVGFGERLPADVHGPPVPPVGELYTALPSVREPCGGD
eukprot:9457308-Alexandrium_andersonii.AAC.1